MTKILKGIFVRGDEIQAIFADGCGYRSPDFGTTWYDMEGEPNSAVDVAFDADDPHNSVIGSSGYLYTCSGVGEINYYEQGATISGVVTRMTTNISSDVTFVGTTQKLYKTPNWGKSVWELKDVPVTDVAIGGNYLADYALPSISGTILYPESDDEIEGLKREPDGAVWTGEGEAPEDTLGIAVAPIIKEGSDYVAYAYGYDPEWFKKYNLTTKEWTNLSVASSPVIGTLALSPDETRLTSHIMGDRDRLQIYTISTGSWVLSSACPNLEAEIAYDNRMIENQIWYDNDTIYCFLRAYVTTNTYRIKIFKYTVSTDTWTQYTNYATAETTNPQGMAFNTAKTSLYFGQLSTGTAYWCGAKYTLATDTYDLTAINLGSSGRRFAYTVDRGPRLWWKSDSIPLNLTYWDCDTESNGSLAFGTGPTWNYNNQSWGFYGLIYAYGHINWNTANDFYSFTWGEDFWERVLYKDSTWQGGTPPWSGQYIYNDYTAAARKALFNLNDLSSSISIGEVRVVSWVGEETAGTAYNILKTHSTEYTSPTRTLTTKSEKVAAACVVNPNTGDVWTETEVNDLIAGVSLQTTSGDTMCDQVYVQVIDRGAGISNVAGTSPIERMGTVNCNSVTYINRARSAVIDGTVRWIDINTPTGLEGVKIATFDKTGGDDPPNDGTYSTRNVCTIGAVASGYQRIPVILDIEIGDFVGFYATSGQFYVDYGFMDIDQLISAGGDNIPCTDVTFSPVNATNKYIPSIRGVMFG